MCVCPLMSLTDFYVGSEIKVVPLTTFDRHSIFEHHEHTSGQRQSGFFCRGGLKFSLDVFVSTEKTSHRHPLTLL